MKIFETSQIKEIDAYTISHEPVSSIDLMERAAAACSEWICKKADPQQSVLFFTGPGNNGGDAWAVARQMAGRGYINCRFYLLNISGKISKDSEINRKRLSDQGIVEIHEIKEEADFPDIGENDLVIDGLFGSGLTRPADGLAAGLIRHINNSGSQVISIDIPSGLFGEDNSVNNSDSIIRAAYTLTFEFPKRAFFYAENYAYTGEWIILPIGLHPGIISELFSAFHYLTEMEIARKIKVRQKFSHKGTYGNALLIAGCYGMMGAAVIASRACLRTGVGLVTAHVPRNGLSIIQTAVPESLISIDQSDIMFTEFPDLSRFNAVAVGPAINCRGNSHKALKTLLEASKVPMVIDADAINILGENKEWLKLVPGNSILTPHPKEFERIAGAQENGLQRNLRQIGMAKQYGVYIVLKGAYTSIACPDGNCYFNTTGNPGMATAGSGDVLTGVILSLLAQGYTSLDAALIGVFIHGLAGDIAAEKSGEYSMISGDITDNLGNAFLKLTNLIHHEK